MQLRSQYHWLLFFSIPKMLQLYKLLSNAYNCDTENLDKAECEMVGEISFQCQNDQFTRDELKISIKVIL